jgi:hypothetical protein
MKSKFACAPLTALVAVASCVGATAAMQPAPRFTSQIESEAAPQPTRADFGSPSVTLAPVDGVSVTLPKGWVACDDANNARLGQAADTLSLAPKVCAGARSDGAIRFGAFDPRPFRTVAVFAGKDADNPTTEGWVARMPQAKLAAMAASGCPIVEKPIADTGAAIDSCSMRREVLAGHAALVYRIVFTPPYGRTAQTETEEWALPTGRGMVDFNLSWSVAARAKVKPVVDAIRASLRVQ